MDLNKKRKEIKNNIAKCSSYLLTHLSERNTREYLEKEKELTELEKEEKEIEKKILLTSPPVASNDKIDLRVIDNEIETLYYIFLYKTDICIGKIRYYGNHIDSVTGDVGYEIYEEYRGKHYSYEALLLLSDLLKAHGIDSFIVTIAKYNIPSIKIIEKYGGILLEDNNGILKYECKTARLKTDEQSQKKAKI